MIKLKTILNEEKTKEQIYIIKCRDYEGSLKKLLNYIKKIGNIGHSFNIIVDPENSDYKETFGWDGDGSDQIYSIEVKNVEVDE